MFQTTRRAALGLALAAAAARTQTPGEWPAFWQWAQALPPDSFPTGGPALFKAYEARLIEKGMPPADAAAAIVRLRQHVQTDPSYQALFYDKVYGRKESLYSQQPNAFLVEVAGALKPGKALDLGMGEGRNSIYLAQHGWDVTGVDLSEVGVASARKHAAAAGIKLNALVQDADKFEYGEKRWDLVCMFYFSGYNYVHDIARRVSAAAKPGGLVISEGPYATPKALMDRWTEWEPFGYTLLRFEYRAAKADWGQPAFGRSLLQKT
jgi:2-polyprenyl-3-methyl-5-hydroxy-6-metoxy-1,4-benzoquinol methylase